MGLIKQILLILAIIYIEVFSGPTRRSDVFDISKAHDIGDVVGNIILGSLRAIAEAMVNIEQCFEHAGFNTTTFENKTEEQIKTDPRYKAFSACMIQKEGLQNLDGSMNIDSIQKYISPLSDIKQDAVLEDCVSQDNADTVETAYFFHKCYEKIRDSDEQVLRKNKRKKLHMECLVTANITEISEINFELNQTNADPKVKNYIWCMFQKQKFQYSDGTINKKRILSDMGALTGAENYTVNWNCLSLNGTDAVDTAYLVFRCIHRKLLSAPSSTHAPPNA